MLQFWGLLDDFPITYIDMYIQVYMYIRVNGHLTIYGFQLTIWESSSPVLRWAREWDVTSRLRVPDNNKCSQRYV